MSVGSRVETHISNDALIRCYVDFACFERILFIVIQREFFVISILAVFQTVSMAAVAKYSTLAVLPLTARFVAVTVIPISKLTAPVHPLCFIILSVSTLWILTENRYLVFVFALNFARVMSNALDVFTLFGGLWRTPHCTGD